MRSDLIAAGMVQHWLAQHAPDVANKWDFQPDVELAGFVDRVLGGFPGLDAQFAGQSATAATAMDLWRLQNVALFGGGFPTPLTPRPSKLLYYTDISDEVRADAARCGYYTRRADVRDAADLAALTGATTAIASGLFHFLSDDLLVKVMGNFARAGFETVVFNNMNENVPDALMQNWARMGFTLYRRTPEDVAALLPRSWRLADALGTEAFFRHHRTLAAEFRSLPHINNVYRVLRAR